MIHGCICDAGYSGSDCSLRTCPRFDDPVTTGQLDEVQLISCIPSTLGTAPTGYFTITWMGATTSQIPATATPLEVQAAISALSTVRTGVAVSSTASSATAVCGTNAGVLSVQFLHNPGTLPPLVPRYTNTLVGGTISVATGTGLGATSGLTSLSDSDVSSGVTTILAISGTKENIECAGRGICDETTGICSCFKNYGVDLQGACSRETEVTNSCPGEIQCSGHGVCSSKTCICSDGWMGGDCSVRTCPKGIAWFAYPDSDQSAHDFAHPEECANNGLCDRSKGECICHAGFAGGSCDHISCPGDPVCSGHGQCLTMKQLALAATVNGVSTPHSYGNNPHNTKTWDHTIMRGCKCDPGFEGYDCSERICPYGDDPMTLNQVEEVQLLSCVADLGSFKLSFRQETTKSIPFNATASQVEMALEGLTTIGDVNVTFTDPTINIAKYVLSSTGTQSPIERCSDAGHTAIATANECNLAATALNLSTGNVTSNTAFDTPNNEYPYGCYVENSTNILRFNANGRTIWQDNDKASVCLLGYARTTSSGACNLYGSTIIIVEFLDDQGDLPAIQADVSLLADSERFLNGAFGPPGSGVIKFATDGQDFGANGGAGGITSRIGNVETVFYWSIDSQSSVMGTREYAECSNRGRCDRTTGICACFPGFAQSNGRGGRGTKADCGFVIPYQTLTTE